MAELRSLRRWLAVAAVWAVAATAISVVAFITASDDDDQRLADTSAQARSIQQRVNRQVEQLETRLATAPSAKAVQDLQGAVQNLQKLIAKRDQQQQQFDRRMRDILKRLATVEQATQDLQQQQDDANANP